MEERRKLERSRLIHYLMIYERGNEHPIGNLVDITPAGIMVITEKPLPVNASLQLQMNFPEEVAGKRKLDFFATTVWRKTDINPDLFANGLRLDKITQEDIDIIEALIEEFRD
jgi:hypothetical protein